MNFSTTSFFQTMRDGTQISVNRWIPDGEIKAVIQLSHGMAEHALRYDRFGSQLAEQGFLVSAHDHRGHGKTAHYALSQNTGMLGYLADHHGFDCVTEDLNEIIQKCRSDFPEKKIILLAHSFGSFVGQSYCERFGTTIDGCILCGSAGPRRLLIAQARVIAFITGLVRGKKHCTPFLNRLAFGSYTKGIVPLKTSYDWLSRDAGEVALYKSDSWCGFVPTTGFFQDMFYGLSVIHRPKNIKKIPVELPIYILYGTDDPVGDYGKTIHALAGIYRKTGIYHVDERDYEGARHELLNETNRNEVVSDIVSWISTIC
jgi:alpha-beta hydrolase superfamily lysophospholipase